MTQSAVTMYVTGWCPYCQRAKTLLRAKNLVVNEIDVDDDPKFRDEMMARSGRRTVPQIFIGQQHIGGCDDLYALEDRGELDGLISINLGGGIDERS
jgi:glutaredoxin 3